MDKSGLVRAKSITSGVQGIQVLITFLRAESFDPFFAIVGVESLNLIWII